MELRQRWCDNATCRDYGKVGAGNIRAFSHVERRYYCATCRRTFSEHKHTFFETLRCPRATVLEALALLVERNSLRAAARLTRHSPNRVLHWLALAGQQGAVVSAALIRDLSLTQVQIDELWTFVIKASSPPAARPHRRRRHVGLARPGLAQPVARGQPPQPWSQRTGSTRVSGQI
jgi:transposase-like protein